MGTLIAYAGKLIVDKSLVLKPIAKMAQSQIAPALNGVALLKELTALNRFFGESKIPNSRASLVPSDEVIFVAEEMGSALHSKQSDFVLNQSKIAGREIVILCGPNSGGKTTWIKASQLNLVLCQLTGRGFFTAASFSPATKIILTVPKQNNSNSSEGRFGVELDGIASHMDRTIDSKTLFGIDEIGSGTSEKAATPVAIPILQTLQFCGVRVLLATHNLDLLESISRNPIACTPLHPEAIQIRQQDGSDGVHLTRKIREGVFPANMDPALYAKQVAQRLGIDNMALDEFRADWLAERNLP
jgi:DNA mismatch repair ATPase MutS